MGFGSADGLPDFRVDNGEEGVRAFDLGMHVGDVEAVHVRHGGAVNRSSAHDEALVEPGGFGFPVCLFERIDAGCLGDIFSAEIEDYVLAAFQRVEGQGEIGRAAHDYRVAVSDGLKILQIFGNMPGQLAFDSDFVLVADCDDEAL